MRQALLPAVSQSLVIQRVFYTASQLCCCSATGTWQLSCLSVLPTRSVILHYMTSCSFIVILFLPGPTGGIKIMFHFSAVPRDLRTKKTQRHRSLTPINSQPFYSHSRKSRL